MHDLLFTWCDIIKAPGLAWSYRKMYSLFRAILASWAVYVVFSYIALMLTVEGRETGFIDLFRYFEFFPRLIPVSPGIVASLVWIAGIVLAMVPIMTALTAVSRIVFEDLRGNSIFLIKEARQFAKDQRYSMLLAALIPGIMVLCFILLLFVFGLIGRIPVIGGFIIAFSALPLFFWSLLGICLFIVFIVGLTLVPAVTACIGEDVLETVIQAMSCVLRQPRRFIWYEATAVIVTMAAALFLGLLCLIAFHVMNAAIGAVMGYTYSEIMTISFYRIPFLMESKACVTILLGLGDSLPIRYIIDTTGASASIKAAGWLFGIMMLSIGVWITSYALSVWQNSQVLIYLVLRKHSKGDDLRLKTHITQFRPEATVTKI